jgi:glutathione S-transferase
MKHADYGRSMMSRLCAGPTPCDSGGKGEEPMTAYPLTALATLLATALFSGLGGLVSQGRGKFGVAAPAVTGHPQFERRFRVHANTLEQLVTLLPVLWLCAIWVGDAWAGLGGLVWCIGRVIYAIGYLREARRREFGFYVTTAPVIAMAIAVVVRIVAAIA